MSRLTAIIIDVVVCIIVSLAWSVNHYRDNATEYKKQRDEKTQALNLANATITDMVTGSVMLLHWMLNTLRT